MQPLAERAPREPIVPKPVASNTPELRRRRYPAAAAFTPRRRAGKEVVEEAFRIHGGYGYSKEYEIERLYRDAPLLLIGEGTSEIQRMVIGKKLLERNKL